MTLEERIRETRKRIHDAIGAQRANDIAKSANKIVGGIYDLITEIELALADVKEGKSFEGEFKDDRKAN